MNIQESQTIEIKESWRDEYLKTICAFANTDGGTLYIGINDIIEDIPNKIISVIQYSFLRKGPR